MSSSDSQPAAKVIADPPKSNAPRKRRRRAPATGATEDCFTCRKRQTRCDRRRPYCSQCLEFGKDCSGYRTTLTWGVGVASRGKLRGMSLPVVNPSSRVSSSPREPKAQSFAPKHPTNSPPPVVKSEMELPFDAAPMSPSSSVQGNVINAGYERSSLATSNPIPIPSAPLSPYGWHVPGFNEHQEALRAISGKRNRSHFQPRPLQRLQTSLCLSYEDSGMSAPSTGSLSTFSDSDYPSPSEFPQTPDDFSMADPFLCPYQDRYFPNQEPVQSVDSLNFLEVPRSFPLSSDDLSSSMSSDNSGADVLDCQSVQSGAFGSPMISGSYCQDLPLSSSPIQSPELVYGPQAPWTITQPSPVDTLVTSSSHGSSRLSVPHFFEPLSFYHLSPRMQFLLDYYDKAICPVLVAYDGPTNPYRMHVLHLAVHSEGLRNAIAALSTNNIRMRGLKDVGRLGFEQRDQPQLTADEIKDMPGAPTAEEARYRTTSIAFLNNQLASPVSAKDDSVLATLLILCLFHVCDSGFAKFRTQLAGVQKLLSLRDRNIQSNFVGWIEMFFTWFDVMTSTVNDRETEVHGDSMDMLNLAGNLGALEHLAGCEGRLFKLIARLGRLNLLSQNRPVRESSTPYTGQPFQQHTPSTPKDYYSIAGNDWYATGSPHTSTPSDILLASDDFPDTRHEFWTEWRLIRRLLEEWTPQTSSASLADADQSLLHISNAFRYSALLYTERLALPGLPPSAHTLQSFVSASLSHLRRISPSSCMNKFLLWPLFVTGTECVHIGDRALIRARIGEVMRESGFFNNLSGLEVLERVWAEDDEAARVSVAGALAEMQSGLGLDRKMGATEQAFRWRRAMENKAGEYIVV